MTQQFGPITFDPVTKTATFPGGAQFGGAVIDTRPAIGTALVGTEIVNLTKADGMPVTATVSQLQTEVLTGIPIAGASALGGIKSSSTIHVDSGTGVASVPNSPAYPVAPGTLSAILSGAVPAAGTFASPSDVTACTLQSNGTSWDGHLGMLANLAAIQALAHTYFGRVTADGLVGGAPVRYSWTGSAWTSAPSPSIVDSGSLLLSSSPVQAPSFSFPASYHSSAIREVLGTVDNIGVPVVVHQVPITTVLPEGSEVRIAALASFVKGSTSSLVWLGASVPIPSGAPVWSEATYRVRGDGLRVVSHNLATPPENIALPLNSVLQLSVVPTAVGDIVQVSEFSFKVVF